MQIKPILTEKTDKEAKKGKYTFLVERSATKNQIKAHLEAAFGVHVKKINTLLVKKGKKAIVRLAEKEKIDLLETKEKK
jgi:large subunit ribosomal protein L23